MYYIAAVHTVYLIKLRDASSALTIVFICRIVFVAVDPQRKHLIPSVNQQFFHAMNVPPVQRILKKSSIVHQHNNSRAAKQPRPFQRFREPALVVDSLQMVVKTLLQILILDAKVDTVLGGIVCRGINDG